MLKHLRKEQIAVVIKAAEALNKIDQSDKKRLTISTKPKKAADELKRWKERLPYRQTLHASIAGLSLDARLELIALMWLGRGDDPEATFEELVPHARSDEDEGDVEYVTAKSPVLPQYLREGLAKLK